LTFPSTPLIDSARLAAENVVENAPHQAVEQIGRNNLETEVDDTKTVGRQAMTAVSSSEANQYTSKHGIFSGATIFGS
jgi:hypothetical protein